MARSYIDVEGEGAAWGAAGFVASVALGVALRPVRGSIDLESVVIVYVIIVALCAAVGGRLAGFFASLSAALAYNFFFTTPYETLRIDSWGQILTVALLFVAGVLASLSGRAGRRARVEARDEAAAIQLLTTVNLTGARGGDVDRVAAQGLCELLGARVVRVVRADRDGELVVAQAGPSGDEDLDPAGLPHLDEEGRLPAGHRRSVGGTLVLPAQGVAVDLVRGRQRVGALVVVPEEDRPLLRPTRMAIAATAHALALAGSARASL
jgi:K+-sensing histidine kinase KdpD